MIRKPILALCAGVALLAQPLAAQEEDHAIHADPGQAAMAAMMEKFKVEPLTADQQARLPVAQIIVDKIMPTGTMNQMMGSMTESLLGPLMELAAEPTSSEAARGLGLEGVPLDLDPAQAAEVLTILDPAWKERRTLTLDVTQQAMGTMLGAMEPLVRKAMAEAYAVHFNPRELTDIDAFFSTPSGATYARKSFEMASDPRIISASFEAMPQMMQSMAEMEKKIADATADLPAERGYDDLTASQRKRLTELTGMDEDTIREGMTATYDEAADGADDAADAAEDAASQAADDAVTEM